MEKVDLIDLDSIKMKSRTGSEKKKPSVNVLEWGEKRAASKGIDPTSILYKIFISSLSFL